MLYFVGVIIAFFLAAILLTKKDKTAADKVLACWLCVIGLHLFLFYWHLSGEIYNYPYLLGIQLPLPLLHGPLLYIYTLTATTDTSFSKRHLVHFIPAILACAVLSKFFLLTNAEKIIVFKNEGAGFELQAKIILIAIYLSGFLYVFLSFYELRRYKKRIANEFSNTEKINLNWLRYLIWGILAIWLIVAMNDDDSLTFGAVVLFVLLLGYFGIRHTSIFTYRQTLGKEKRTGAGRRSLAVFGEEDIISSGGGYTPVGVNAAAAESITGLRDEVLQEKGEPFDGQVGLRNKYERSGLQEDAAVKIHFDLTELMQTERTYKDAELSLMALAEKLRVHPNNLSQVINSYENKNFYDYINTLRIEEFKKIVLLPENGRYTLLSLAFECGFNSKTSFNRNFKKITGQAPSAYLKKFDVYLDTE